MSEKNGAGSQKQNQINRRSVLAKLGAGGVAGLVGATGQAVADSELELDGEARELYDRYNSEEAIEEAVETHASGVIEELHSRGEISTTDIDKIVNDPTRSEKTEAPVFPDGDSWRAIITVEVNNTVTLQVEPSEEKSHGKIDREDGSQFIKSSELEEDTNSNIHVGTMDHSTSTCYSNYEICYPGGTVSVKCYTFEVYECESGCVSHRTGRYCSTCSLSNPPC